MEQLALMLKDLLHPIAEISASILELIGILIIIIGTVRALVRLVDSIVKKKGFHVAMDLGKALSLALEFKMGAEIIKTVIIHNLEELAILGIVVIIRALLSVVIHWEMRLEEKENAKKEKENTK
jgi:uncharacterized membrane protein